MKKSKWIGWEGDYFMPVNPDSWIKAMLRSGLFVERKAGALRWFHCNPHSMLFSDDFDIVAYRVISPC